MKRALFILIMLLAVAASGQVRFVTSDSIAVTATLADTTFSTERYETAYILFVGCNGLIRFATNTQDTVGWALRTGLKRMIYVPENTAFAVEADRATGIAGLYRLNYGAASGTGIMYIVGTKAVAE
jgi:hypothetical protein